VTSRHFDVVVLGRSLGSLVAAALLARRDLRVLLLGQGERAPTYAFRGRRLARRRFSVPYGDSVVWRRVLRDLAQSQTFRRHAQRLTPSYCLLGAERRVQVWSDPEQLALEVVREFAEVRQLCDELAQKSLALGRALEEPLASPAVCPPESVLERLRARRYNSQIPSIGEDAAALLAKFPLDHPYRASALVPAWFAADSDGPPASMPALAFARLSLALATEPLAFEGGQDKLEDFWLEHIRAHGGTCELGERATELVVRNRRVVALRCAGGDEPIGADSVLANLSGQALMELARGEGLRWTAERNWPTLRAGAGRFVLSAIVRRELLPEPLGQEAFLLPEQGSGGRELGPALHLQCLPCEGAPDERLLVVETIVPASELGRVRELRRSVLERLRREFPFLDRHLIAVDSPHDGLPLDAYAAGQSASVERRELVGASAAPEPLERRWHAERWGFLGLAAESVRGPIRGTYLVGKTVLPPLGEEGELIAAWSAAQLVTGRDAHRQRRRRQMWSKLDTE
jgi:phytoene dehydrogenase-like protein